MRYRGKTRDESLRTEREDARTAEQRAELHAKLSSMLYGIEAAPRNRNGLGGGRGDGAGPGLPGNQNQIQLARGEGEAQNPRRSEAVV